MIVFSYVRLQFFIGMCLSAIFWMTGVVKRPQLDAKVVRFLRVSLMYICQIPDSAAKLIFLSRLVQH